jgi:hypothetical protein
LIVAALHVAIVGGVGARYAADRATLPRVWTRVAPVDPNLPIRGRYVRIRVEVDAPGILLQPTTVPGPGRRGQPAIERPPLTAVTLTVRDDRLVAAPTRPGEGVWLTSIERDGERVPVLQQPLAFFIPEHVPDPSVRAAGEELWVEVSVPRRGPPRPVRLGVKRDGVLMPLGE